MERGFNGSAGWEKNPRGVNDLSGEPLANLKSGTLFRDIKIKEQFSRMSVRKDKLNGKDVNVLTGAALNGKRERLYFDAETGLLLRRITFTQTPIGVIPEQTDYEDYRDVDGVKLPFTIKSAGVDNFSTGTRKFTEIKSTLRLTMRHSINRRRRPLSNRNRKWESGPHAFRVQALGCEYRYGNRRINSERPATERSADR